MNVAFHPGYWLVDICSGSGMLGESLHFAMDGHIRTVAYVEREACAAATLVARMEDQALDTAPVWDDVDGLTSPEFLDYVQGFRPLAVCAGYPCQPFSHAGKRLGESDPRHLWPAIDRFIGAAEPELVFLENVPGHLGLGFGTVRRNLESRGYAVEAGLFSAAEVGASHERARLFILAVAGSHGNNARWSECEGQQGRSKTVQPGGEVANSGDGQFQDTRRGEEERAGLDCFGAVVANTPRQREREQNDTPGGVSRERAREVVSGGSGYVADPAGERGKRIGLSPVRRYTAGHADRTGAPLADFVGQRLQGNEQPGAHEPAGEEPRESASKFCLPLFAPGPGDFRAWGEILERFPAVEPGICRTIDGMAGRMDPDRLRLTGNGVVPLAAAYAFLSLAAVHARKRGLI